jgi:hypothetical protein
MLVSILARIATLTIVTHNKHVDCGLRQHKSVAIVIFEKSNPLHNGTDNNKNPEKWIFRSQDGQHLRRMTKTGQIVAAQTIR